MTMNLDSEAEAQGATTPRDPTAPFPSGSPQPVAVTSPASLPPILNVRTADKLADFYEPCPQGDDCAGDGKHRRLFACDQGCGFRGCAACMEVHESEPHA